MSLFHPRGNHRGVVGAEGIPLMTASTKVLQRTYEATTLQQTSRRRGNPTLRGMESGSQVTDDDDRALPKTTDVETVVHLLKGYLGAGCLSLPYAVSQLGVMGGFLSIVALSYWTSSNCYTVVNIKRHMEKTTQLVSVGNDNTATASTVNDGNHEGNDAVSEASSSNITYPDVGNWAYGAMFQSYVSACIITLQLAVCTVYVSFIGENILAVAHFCGLASVTHTIVVTVALPIILGLSLLPSLKILAPVMAVGTILLLVTLSALGTIVWEEWSHRPPETPMAVVSQIPLALCMILYSYEGINLILPVHAAMKYPSHFDFVFWFSMILVALCLAGVAIISVLCFGDVTNGSLTAFLLDAYKDDTGNAITEWIMFANTTVSLSVLLTYPLTMYPAIELLGPILQRNTYLSRFFGGIPHNEDEDELAVFEPLPPLPEHDAVSQHETVEHHSYDEIDKSTPLDLKGGAQQQDEDVSSGVPSLIGTDQTLFRIHFSLPGDSAQLRVTLVLTTYLIAIGIPNVQALISLVGALAGSSAALLIPPVLELAWIEHLEHIDEVMTHTPFAGAASPIPTSPYMLRKQKMRQKKHQKKWCGGGKYWMTKVKCYTSFALGVVFLGIGTSFSVVDIVNIYRKRAA